jgi:hypothetical protein
MKPEARTTRKTISSFPEFDVDDTMKGKNRRLTSYLNPFGSNPARNMVSLTRTSMSNWFRGRQNENDVVKLALRTVNDTRLMRRGLSYFWYGEFKNHDTMSEVAKLEPGVVSWLVQAGRISLTVQKSMDLGWDCTVVSEIRRNWYFARVFWVDQLEGFEFRNIWIIWIGGTYIARNMLLPYEWTDGYVALPESVHRHPSIAPFS